MDRPTDFYNQSVEYITEDGSKITLTVADPYAIIYDKYPNFDSLEWKEVYRDNIIDFAAEKAKRQKTK